MEELLFFDADCRVGDFIDRFPDAAGLIGEMDYYGISRALIRHNAIPMGPLSSNTEIANMLREDSSGRLTGVWCILPDSCGEIPAPDIFFRQMKENRIGALTLSPFEHRYQPRRIVIGRLWTPRRNARSPFF